MKRNERTILLLASMMADLHDRLEALANDSDLNSLEAANARLEQEILDLETRSAKINLDLVNELHGRDARIQEMQQAHRESLANRDQQITELKQQIRGLGATIEELEGAAS